jgi:protein TonB
MRPVRVTSFGAKALVASVVLHTVLLLLLLGLPSFSRGGRGEDVVVDIITDPPSPAVTAPSRPRPRREAKMTSAAPRDPAAPSHDPRSRDPRVAGAADPPASTPRAVAAPIASAETANEDMPRFAIAVGPAAPSPASPSDRDLPGVGSAPPIDEGAVDSPARLLRGVAPSYPDAARGGGIEGDVRLEIVVGPSGVVESARVVHGVGPPLDDAALDAVRLFRFAPATKAGRAVRVRMTWTIDFRLR